MFRFCDLSPEIVEPQEALGFLEVLGRTTSGVELEVSGLGAARSLEDRARFGQTQTTAIKERVPNT